MYYLLLSFTWKVQFHELIRFEMHFATFSKVKWPMTQVIARRYLSLMDIKKYIMVSKNHIFSVQHIRYMSKLSIAKSTIITWGSFFYCKLKQHVIENIGIYFQCICYRKTVISDCGKVIYIHGKKCLQINIFITNLKKHCPLGYWTDI